MLIDNHGRQVSYLRLAVTDRCNMRCVYCMPEMGNTWLSRAELMSYEEMFRFCSIAVKMGIKKIRITGGEPFVRKDIMAFLKEITQLEELQEVTLTTNGVLTAPFIPQLKALGICSVNLSLDSLNRQRFFSITRRDDLAAVIQTLHALLECDMQVKINTVVMEDKNIEDIIPLVELTREKNIAVRFIEEMPFNGGANLHSGINWNHARILHHIKKAYPQIQKIPDPPFSTAYNYSIPGHKGTVGIIAAYSRSFCGSCNRLRVTPQGEVKTCLYGSNVLNVKELMRENKSDADITLALTNAIKHRAKNGWEAEKKTAEKITVYQSMATIGG